jgi:hypothetical protein
MKIISFVLLLMASWAFVLVGCSDNSAPVVAPGEQALSAPTSFTHLVKEGVLNSVTGSCQTYLVFIHDPALGDVLFNGPKSKESFYNTMTFSAIKHADGTYSGTFVSQYHGVAKDERTGFLAKVQGRVLHVAVQDNMGKIVFQISGGDYAGWWGVLAFKDLGEGGTSAPPDMQSVWEFSDQPATVQVWESQTPQEFIDWTVETYQPYFPWFQGWFPIDNGDVQVH